VNSATHIFPKNHGLDFRVQYRYL